MISLTGKVSKVNLPGGPIVKSHMTQRCLDALASENITEGYWLGFRSRYFNSNKHEWMRAETLGIYLLKYLHHSNLNWIMMNFDIQTLINHRSWRTTFGYGIIVKVQGTSSSTWTKGGSSCCNGIWSSFSWTIVVIGKNDAWCLLLIHSYLVNIWFFLLKLFIITHGRN